MNAMTMYKNGEPPEMLSCRDLVQLITDYWEGVLAPDDAARFERHMALCGPCEDYVEQMRLSARAVSALRKCDVAEDTREALLEMFRAWKSEPSQ